MRWNRIESTQPGCSPGDPRPEHTVHTPKQDVNNANNDNYDGKIMVEQKTHCGFILIWLKTTKLQKSSSERVPSTGFFPPSPMLLRLSPYRKKRCPNGWISWHAVEIAIHKKYSKITTINGIYKRKPLPVHNQAKWRLLRLQHKYLEVLGIFVSLFSAALWRQQRFFSPQQTWQENLRLRPQNTWSTRRRSPPMLSM